MVFSVRAIRLGCVYSVVWYGKAAKQVEIVNSTLSNTILDWDTFPDFCTVLSLSK